MTKFRVGCLGFIAVLCMGAVTGFAGGVQWATEACGEFVGVIFLVASAVFVATVTYPGDDNEH